MGLSGYRALGLCDIPYPANVHSLNPVPQAPRNEQM
jgi:hypothetical protein